MSYDNDISEIIYDLLTFSQPEITRGPANPEWVEAMRKVLVFCRIPNAKHLDAIEVFHAINKLDKQKLVHEIAFNGPW